MLYKKIVSGSFYHLRAHFFSSSRSGSKVCKDVAEALQGIKDGDTILSGGFGLAGIPENSISYIKKIGIKNLTYVSNTGGSTSYYLELDKRLYLIYIIRC
jgi:hypothetical protein